MQTDELKPIIEAALLAASHPLSRDRLAGLFAEGEAPSASDIAAVIDQLREDSAGRGIELVEVASGYRYQVRQDVHAWISRLWAERPARYSRALLETLALIAYRQPITRGEIEQVRGVVVSTGIIRTLEEREWIRVVGYRDVPGKPALYGTTRQFLDYFQLTSLDQLPPLAEVRDMEAFEPQLDFDGGADPATQPALEVDDDAEPGQQLPGADDNASGGAGEATSGDAAHGEPVDATDSANDDPDEAATRADAGTSNTRGDDSAAEAGQGGDVRPDETQDDNQAMSEQAPNRSNQATRA
ncbi:MAG TPA: SMC-Scp complex subunit ScpB [Rhodanobacteraceae bacterium]|nr:SMC-Scp complex subunit ScpB [Rhodanobacteraceae bacterium]